MARGLIRKTLAGTAALVGLIVYAFWVEPNWIHVSMHDLRKVKGGDRMRIVQLSDLHLREVTAFHARVAEHVRALEPDLVVLSGDVFDEPDLRPELIHFLGMLGPLSTVAVLGNWEHWGGFEIKGLRADYRRKGVRLLVNEAASGRVRTRTLGVVGLDDFTAGIPALDPSTLRPDDDITVLVQHSPGYFEHAPKPTGQPFDLCLSGHTHGGQITLFGLALWTPPGSGPFVSGFYDTPMCRLYVSKGLGTSIAPARFGARPEIAVFDL